jgi:hypothetical protein
MHRRSWALISLVYLAFAEVLSWAPVSDLSLCLIQPEHNEQASDHDSKKYCPAFHVGAALAFEKADSWLERHDKSVIGAFTIVLAISTIGLWLATNKLWAAGERQIRLSQYATGISASAIGVTREIGEAQVRAYVRIKQAEIYFLGDDGLPMIEITAVNSGQSPALDFTWAPQIFYLSDEREEKVKEPHEEWAEQPGIDIHSASETTATYIVDDFVLTQQISVDGVTPDKIAVSVTIHYAWTDVFENSFTDVASFAGMAVVGDAKENRRRIHPLNTSAWFCRLDAIAKGQSWSGIAVQAPPEQETSANHRAGDENIY